MAFKTPINSPLTDTQLELTSKIGAIKSLLALPIKISLNLPKKQQISTFDYLMKILKAMGVTPEILFQVFLDKVFSEANTFLEEKVLESVGAMLDAKGIKLSSSQSNATVLKNSIPATFLVTVKLKMAQELTLMIFGPKDGRKAETLVPDPARRQFLMDEAVCGSNMFYLSNPTVGGPITTDQDVEFNKISLKEQLEKGEVQFEVSCQDVKISLPDDPGFFFTQGGPNTIPGSSTNLPPTPSQGLANVINYVDNKSQQINNQDNTKKIGKSFFEALLQKLLSYITTLVFPYLGAVFSFLNSTKDASGNSLPPLNPENSLYGNCAINDKANTDSECEKTAFSSMLMNLLYKALLAILLLFVIKELKKLAGYYFSKLALERLKRKALKIKLKFKIFKNIPDLTKAARIAAAIAALAAILIDDDKNNPKSKTNC